MVLYYDYNISSFDIFLPLDRTIHEIAIIEVLARNLWVIFGREKRETVKERDRKEEYLFANDQPKL